LGRVVKAMVFPYRFIVVRAATGFRQESRRRPLVLGSIAALTAV